LRLTADIASSLWIFPVRAASHCAGKAAWTCDSGGGAPVGRHPVSPAAGARPVADRGPGGGSQ